MGTRGVIAKAKARSKANNKEKPEKKVFIPNFEAYGEDDYYRDLDLLNNDKNRENFIKSIERIIRTSPEYRNYIRFLKTEAELAYCTVMNKLPEEVSKLVKIEMHHYPLTLFTIVDIILKKHLYLEACFTRLSIANEVMNNHFMNRVGIVPLTVTIHQMMHTGNNLINPKDIFGDYDAFLLEYDSFVDTETKADVFYVKNLNEKTIERNVRNALTINPNIFEELDVQDFHRITFKERELEEEDIPETFQDIKPTKTPSKQKMEEPVEVYIDEEEEDIEVDRSPIKTSKKPNKKLSEFEFDDEE